MADDEQVRKLLDQYTPEQLARAYLKASRERNEAVRLAKEARAMATMKDKLGKYAQAFGL